MLRELIYLILLSSFVIANEGNHLKHVSGLVGGTIRLPCLVNTDECGDLQSIQWYRVFTKIYSFSKSANISLPESVDYSDRAEMIYTPNSTVSYLEIRQLLITDDEIFMCEVNYVGAREGCQYFQFVRLDILRKPEFVRIIKEDGTDVSNASTIAFDNRNDSIILTCESGGGKPVPSIHWWNGTTDISGEYEVENVDGIDLGRNRLRIPLSQTNLGTKYECGVYNEALETLMTAWVEIKANEGPTVELTMYPPSPVNELDNENITIHCQIVTGNPDTLLAVRWYLNGELLKELPECSPSFNNSFCDVDPSKLLLEKVDRFFQGNYSCMGRNKSGWGIISPNTELIVYYKSECETTQTEEGGKLILICKPKAKPIDVDFTWELENENRTTKKNIQSDHLKNFLTFENKTEYYKMYSCFVNNSRGVSNLCERRGTENTRRWWESLEIDANTKTPISNVAILGFLVIPTVTLMSVLLLCLSKKKAVVYYYVQYVSSTGNIDNSDNYG